MADKDSQAPAKYPVTRLIEDSYRFFGVEPHVAAGAFHKFARSEATVDEAKKLLDSFANRKVG